MKKMIVVASIMAAIVAVAVTLRMRGVDEAEVTAATAERGEPSFYRHPMNPSITSPVPAKDDMGMDYIPVFANASEAEDDALVRVSPAMVNNLGVRTAQVTRGPIAREIDTVGYVDFDERLVSQVNLRVAGWIEELQVRTRGERVRRGDLLLKIYSPELEAAQREYLQSVSSGGSSVRSAGAQRLRALGLNRAQIERLNETRQPEPLVPVFARQGGIVAEMNVREGVFVTPGSTLMTLAGLESVWVLVDVFERQADWVAVGQTAEVRLPHKPNGVWTGEVEYIYPQLDPKTRTLKARLRFSNPDETLRPNMYANVTVYADPRMQALSVPSAAVIRTGEGARVILAHGEGRFHPVPVETGIESEDRVEILDGLASGDQVVVSAQFLLDSEASLQASLRRMTEPRDHTHDSRARAAPRTIAGAGTLESIDPGARRVSISHAPIRELGWPAMTMDFALDAPVVVSGLQPGERVRFRLREADAGFVIVELEPAE